MGLEAGGQRAYHAMAIFFAQERIDPDNAIVHQARDCAFIELPDLNAACAL
ncbi:hypothetical protein FSO04_35155 [Paraburkholderia madseniana]|uniref:Uncharacterized protein n=1 Tax=Paraburkholderia madseniana TaxID=2599607 RepID=A0A6N6W6V9_9BURK|nr:hypothetical protein [Paraburkholderia madseniana]KAE8755300.1 hypothetical protein FSO04_35155 [Paraburkholderia madseniana]